MLPQARIAVEIAQAVQKGKRVDPSLATHPLVILANLVCGPDSDPDVVAEILAGSAPKDVFNGPPLIFATVSSSNVW